MRPITLARHLTHLLSARHEHRGIVLSMLTRPSRAHPFFKRVAAALDLIDRYDPPTFRQLLRRVDRIHLTLLGIHQARWLDDVKTCELDQRYVDDQGTSLEDLAGTIVHELAHARIDAFGIALSSRNLARIERICFAAELEFGRRLPAGDSVITKAQAGIALPDSFWTPAADRERREDALRELGTSEWIVRL
jgi:hypothetical protein